MPPKPPIFGSPMRFKAFIFSVFLGCSCATWPDVGAAQPTPGADAGAEADAHFARGKAALKQGKKQEALAAYKEAFALKQSFDVAGNLGSLELDMGLFRDAAEHLDFAIRHYAATGSTAAQLAKARGRYVEATREVQIWKVDVEPAGAEVFVDGVSVGIAPFDHVLFVAPGSRSIEARLAQHEPRQQTLLAVKGATGSVQLKLQPIQAAVPAGIPPVAATGNGAGEKPPPPPATPPTTKEFWPTWPVYAGAGAAAVSAAVGMVFVLSGSSASSDADEKRDQLAGSGKDCGKDGCPDLVTAYQDADSAYNTAVPLLVVAGLLAGATVGYAVVFAGEPDGSGSAVIAPTAGPEQVGMIFRGAF